MDHDSDAHDAAGAMGPVPRVGCRIRLAHEQAHAKAVPGVDFCTASCPGVRPGENGVARESGDPGPCPRRGALRAFEWTQTVYDSHERTRNRANVHVREALYSWEREMIDDIYTDLDRRYWRASGRPDRAVRPHPAPRSTMGRHHVDDGMGGPGLPAHLVQDAGPDA